MIYYTDGCRHLVCLPYSIENLHKMAEDLEIKRCWFHKDHYDIPAKRLYDITKRCTIVRPRDIINIIKGKDEKRMKEITNIADIHDAVAELRLRVRTLRLEANLIEETAKRLESILPEHLHRNDI
jgi:hypothetical protein